MTTEWHPVRQAEDLPEGRVVQVMLTGGAERLACRVRIAPESVTHLFPGERLEVVADYLTGRMLLGVIAWRDVPGHEPMPAEMDLEALETLAA